MFVAGQEVLYCGCLAKNGPQKKVIDRIDTDERDGKLRIWFDGCKWYCDVQNVKHLYEVRIRALLAKRPSKPLYPMCDVITLVEMVNPFGIPNPVPKGTKFRCTQWDGDPITRVSTS